MMMMISLGFILCCVLGLFMDNQLVGHLRFEVDYNKTEPIHQHGGLFAFFDADAELPDRSSPVRHFVN